MKTIDDNQLDGFLRELLDKCDIDFIASAISHWHAIGVDSCVYSLYKNANRKIKGIIIIKAHAKNGYIINESNFICSTFAEVDFILVSDNMKARQSFKNPFQITLALINLALKKEIGKNIGIISVVQPNIRLITIFKNRNLAFKYNPIFYLIDEGIGTYTSQKAWENEKSVDTKDCKFLQSYFLFKFYSYMKCCMSTLLGLIVLKYMECHNLFLFEIKEGKLNPIRSEAINYRNVIKIREKQMILRNKIIHNAIIITDMLSEYHYMSLIDELELIERISIILIDNGYCVYIKPHPRETQNKYEFLSKAFDIDKLKIMKQDISIEETLNEINPKAVIGFSSTALLTAKILFEINSINITHKCFKNLKIMPHAMIEFENITKKIGIKHINNLDDLYKVL